MKAIKAIIQPHMLDRVVRALHELPHFPGLTLQQADGQARGRGPQGAYLADEEGVSYHKKAVVAIVCTDEQTDQFVETIRAAAHTGRAGDGIVFVTEIVQVVRIGSGEQQEQAL